MRRSLTVSLLLWCSLLLCQVARADGVTHVAFSETFDVNQSTGGRDGAYSGSGVASGDIAYIQEGWIGSKSSSYVYGGSACLRFGNANNDGSCTSPEFVLIGAAKTATLTYSAAGWGGGTNKLTISANDGVTLGGDTQVTLANGQWKTYSVTLTLTTATSVQLTFSGRRGFLDDVTVTETVTSIDAPTLTDACTFWPNTTEEAVMTVTVVPADSTTVYYTTDGTEPTPSNGHVAMLTSNFSIEGTTTVKARAYFKTLSSDMVSRTYTQGATVGNIAAFKALADGTETRLAISADAHARVLHGYNNKVYLRDNSGAICFDFGTTAVFNPAPVHNQHVAGWIVGRKQTENGLPKLVATGNTTTDYLAMAAPVTEAATEPAAIIADADGHFALSGNVGDWVSVSGGRIAASSMVSNQFGIQDYTEVYDGALVDVSAIVTANNQLAPVTYDGIKPVVYVVDEDQDFVSPGTDIQHATVRLKRTLSKDHWNTLTVPFGMTMAGRIREYDYADGNTMRFKNAAGIEAGKPYLVKPDETVENPMLTDVTLTAAAPQTVTSGGYSFVGRYSPTELATNKTELFLKSDGHLYYAAAGNARMPGARAYFKVPEGQQVRLLADDADVTGIASTRQHETTADSSTLYDLQGRRVTQPKKGVYVRDGKKVIIH